MGIFSLKFSADERARQDRPELIQFVGTVSQPVIICHIVKEFLRIQSAAKEESKIAVGSLNDVGDFVDGFASVKGILVRESIFDAIGDGYAFAERLGHAREKCGIYDGCFAYRSSERCRGGSALKHGRYIWPRATLLVHTGPNGARACRHGH